MVVERKVIPDSFHDRELAFFLTYNVFYCVSILHLVVFGGPRIDVGT